MTGSLWASGSKAAGLGLWGVVLLSLVATVSAFGGERAGVSLDGAWEFRFAADDRGTAEHWEAAGTRFERAISVPGCWDAQGVGAETAKLRHNAVGVGWYRRGFSVPAEWRRGGARGRRVWLVVGGVHRSAVVFVNGREVVGSASADGTGPSQGEIPSAKADPTHFGYPVAIRLDITGQLAGAGEQSLVIAVDSRRHVERDPLYGAFDLPDYMYVDWGGIFEHVRLESTGEAWIDDAFIRTDPQRRHADVDVQIGGATDGGEVTAAYVVAGQGRTGELAKGDVPIRGGRATTIPLDLPAAPLWTPERPNLLTLELVIRRGGDVLDQRRVRFGMKRLEVKGGQFVLNGDAVFLRGYGDDFNFPRELLPPADVTFWKAYLQKRKDFGFNFVRHHSMMVSESYLEAADEVGMLVQPELPILYMEWLAKATAEGRKLYAKVWEGYVRQMRNHPSVMSWCMGNEELNGLPFGAEFYKTAKTLDPDRPVIDSDGLAPGVDRPTLDYRSVQFDEHAMPWGASRGKYVNHRTDKPTVVHEMGNFSCLPDPAEAERFDGTIKPFWLDAERAAVHRQHLEDVLPAMLKASQRLQASLIKLNAEAARLGPGVNGYEQWLFRDYWDQSSGIESIVGTTRELTAETARQFNADAVLLWDRDRVNYRAGQEIPLKIVLSDDRPGDAEKIEHIAAKLDYAAIELKPPTTAPARGNIGPWTGQMIAPAVATPTKLMLSADAGGVHNEWPVWIWPAAPAPSTDVTIAHRLTADLITRLQQGASVLLLDEQLAFPTQTATFKPAWWHGDERGDFVHGNFFADHPAVKGFPHDGYGDLQAYGLLNDRPVVNLDELPGGLRPIVGAIDVPWKLRRMAYLWEARVGKGKLLVSSFDLSPARRKADPAAEWMCALLTRYAASATFQPAGELPPQWLRERVEKFTLPAPADCVEGFDRMLDFSERASWFTEREPAAEQYVVRQTTGDQHVRWRTAAVPAGWSHDTVTFVWSGGIGYRSQPAAGPFELSMNGHELCGIAFTDQPAEWKCEGGGELRYLVLRRTTEDTVGLFLLTLPAARVKPGEPVELILSAPGGKSRRWISVVPYRDAIEALRGD